MLPSFKKRHYTYSKHLTNLETINFVIFGEALQFETVVLQLCTFHMDLHPTTHVQLKIPLVDI